MSWSSIIIAVCSATYCLGTLFLWREINGNNNRSRLLIPSLTIVAVALHGILLSRSIYTANAPNISLWLAISMSGWISVTLYLCISFVRKTSNLGIVVLPIGLIAVLVGSVSMNLTPLGRIPHGVGWHIVLAIPVYGVLCVAFAQACLLIIQDRLLHKPNQGRILPMLPAIQTMEANLFWLTLLGFLLMTLNLVVGMISNLNNIGTLLNFNHHILFSILAWLCFACLLCGRKIAGWRGQTAAKWTITAFGILILAYFGTRFVNELVLSKVTY